MNMFGWIFSGVFLLLAALAILTGMLKGKKYTWRYSVARILVVIFSVIVSVILAKLSAYLVSNALYGVVLNLFDADLSEVIGSIGSAKDLIYLLVTIVLVPVLFYPVFLIVRGLMTLLVRPLVALVDVIAKAIRKACKKGEEAETAAEAEVAPATEAEENGKKKKKKKLSRKQKRYGVTGPNWVGAICGGVCSFMVLCVFLIPIAGALDTVEEFVEVVEEESNIAAENADGDEENVLSNGILNTVLDIGHGLCNNVGSKVVNYTGGKLVYDWMLSVEVGDEEVELEEDLDFVAEAVGAYFYADGEDPAALAAEIRELGPAFSETSLLPNVMAELISKAATAWSEGEEFLDMEAPLGLEGSDEMMQELAADVWDVLKDTDEDTVKADVNSLCNILASAVEHDAADMLKEFNIKSFLKEQDFLESVFYEILANDQLEVLAESTLDYGLELTLDRLGVRFHMAGAYEEMMAKLEAVDGNTDAMARAYAAIMDDYGLATEIDWKAVAELVQNGTSIRNYVAANVAGSQAEFETKTVLVTIDDVIATHQGQGSDRVTDSALEAKKLAATLYQMGVVLDQEPAEGSTGGWNLITLFPEFGPVLDSLASTEIIGYDETILFMTAFLQSPSVSDNMMITTLNANSIAQSIRKGTSKEGGFTGLMKSMSKTLEVVQKAAEHHSEGLKQEDIQDMIANIDTTTAEIMQIMFTPDMIVEYGGEEVQRESAEKVSSMMGDAFVNLAAAKEAGNMTAEQIEKESKAVTQMMNVMMSAGERNDENVFGEAGVLGTDANDYVETLLDSTVLSDTLIETVYNGDSIENDPLKIGKALDDAEQNELVAALDAQYDSASAAQKADKSFQKKLVAAAAVMNVSVEITANGVELVG